MDLPGWASLAGIGLIVGLWLYWHQNAPRTTTLLFLNGGTVIAGLAAAFVGGLLTAALNAIDDPVQRWTGIGVSTLVAGVALVAVLEVICKGILPFRRFKPKPQRWHPWLALVLPLVVAIAGVPLLTTVVNAFTLLDV